MLLVKTPARARILGKVPRVLHHNFVEGVGPNLGPLVEDTDACTLDPVLTAIVPVENSDGLDASRCIKRESHPPTLGVLGMAESVWISIDAIILEVRGSPGI
jgi:hypothetical protein